MDYLCKVQLGGYVKTYQEKSKRWKKIFVQRVCIATLNLDGWTWKTVPYARPKKFREHEWLLVTNEIKLNLIMFSDIVDRFRDGKHQIRPRHLDGLKPNDEVCAIRRALRALRYSKIISDIPIRACIEWGIEPDMLPTEWPDNQPAIYKTK